MTDIKFFRVGGCVRDSLLNIPTKDIDFAVEAPDFDTMLEAVEARCTKIFRDNDGVPVGSKFFTLRGIDPVHGPVDFVLCRKDGPSSDGRRPDFVEPGTLFDDLARRDFTVNAIAMDDEDNLIDPHNGQIDLANKMLRFVGIPEERLTEDALRAFRGFRFEVTKKFTLDERATDAINNMRESDFTAVSTERIREELVRCFSHDTRRTLALFGEFPNLLDITLNRGIWFEPSVKIRNRDMGV